MKNTDKIIRFHKVGNADVLKLEEVEEQAPEQGEVKIKVDAFALNRADIMFRTGNYLEQPTFPSKIGYEASGVVEKVGPGVTSVSVGDKVSTIPAFSMGKYGIYGYAAIVPEHALSKYPNTLSAEEGTSIWMSFLTAYGAIIDIGKVKADDYVIITAASSSVGLAAIAIAKSQNAHVIAVTRTNQKAGFLKSKGADFVIALESDDLEQSIDEITAKKGANLIFDPVAGAMLSHLAKVAAPCSTIIEYGALANDETVYPLFDALAKGLKIQGYTLFEITGNVERLKKAKAFIHDALQKKLLHPVIDKVFNLEEIVEAHQYMESNQQKGKIVIKVN